MNHLDSNTPSVSIIMNCLDCSKYLREAIDSVYAQTYKNWEIIFWDNASSDNSAEIARSYDKRLKYFRGEETVLLYAARNLALKETKGEFISFLDCDDKWLPQKLEKQIYVLENRPDIDFIYSNYFKIIMPRSDRLILGLKSKQPEGSVFERFLYHYPVNLQTVVLRKAVLNKLDTLFDEKLNLSGDYDLFMRVLYNSKAAYLHDPLIIYRIHSDMCSIRFMSDYPKENSYIIEKLKRMDPFFEVKYKAVINYINAKISYWEARSAMANASNKKAREYLSPYKLLNFNFFILYLATFFPKKIWDLLQEIKMRNIVS